jgi:flavin reductase (DIM6/NTAB) family NADH-FMN oxidoreductase RutF
MKSELPTSAGLIVPMPNAIVSCRDKDGSNNALVVAFAANASLDPPMVMVGVVPDRFSHHMVKESGEFVVNLPAKTFSDEFNYLGTKSGRDGDKFAALNLKWEEGTKINAPLLSDCPVSIECKVVASIQPGTHELFVGTVEAVHCDEAFLDSAGAIDIPRLIGNLL